MIKPHLYLKKGYWCVSKKPKPYQRYTELWNKAYLRTFYLNFESVRN